MITNEAFLCFVFAKSPDGHVDISTWNHYMIMYLRQFMIFSRLEENDDPMKDEDVLFFLYQLESMKNNKVMELCGWRIRGHLSSWQRGHTWQFETLKALNTEELYHCITLTCVLQRWNVRSWRSARFRLQIRPNVCNFMHLYALSM